MGVGAYVYLPLSSLQPLAPTAAVSSILSTYPSCPTNCVLFLCPSLSLSPFFFFLSSIYIAVSLSLRSSPLRFPLLLRFNPTRRNAPHLLLLPLLSFLPSYVSACTKRMFRTRSACARVNAAGFTLY